MRRVSTRSLPARSSGQTGKERPPRPSLRQRVSVCGTPHLHRNTLPIFLRSLGRRRASPSPGGGLRRVAEYGDTLLGFGLGLLLRLGLLLGLLLGFRRRLLLRRLRLLRRPLRRVRVLL